MKRIQLITILVLLGSLLIGCSKDKKGTETEDAYGRATVTPSITQQLEQTKPEATPEPTNLPIAKPAPYTGPITEIMTKENYPRVDGSTATIPLSEAVYSLATGATSEEASNEVIHTRTSNAYYRLAWKEVDLLIVYAPSKEVIEDLDKGGYRLNMKPIGKDALVFMANASNPVDSLTHEQLIDIYSGKITDWSQVGGDKEELLAFQRPENSGSQTLMQKLVMKDTLMMEGPNVLSFESMEGILEAMVDYSNEGNTLGYSVFYYAKNMYQMPELKFMKVNDIEPSLNTIYDNSYPYINEFYAVIREDEPESSNAHKIFDWLTTEEGQGLVKELGYVPVAMNGTGVTINQEYPKASLGENNYYITASYSNYLANGPIGTVTIYKDNWEIIQVFHNASVGIKGIVPKNSVIPLAYTILQGDGSYQLKAGLYSLAEETFITPVAYERISVLDDTKGYYIVTKLKQSMIIDKNGNELVTGLDPDLWVSEVVGEETYRLLSADPEGSIRKYYCFDDKLNLLYSYQDKYYVDFELHDHTGKLILSEELFSKTIGLKVKPSDMVSIYGYGPKDDMVVAEYNRKVYLMDLERNIIEQSDNSLSSNVYFSVFEDIYLKGSYDEEKQTWHEVIYDKQGKPITDSQGRTYGKIYSQQISGQVLYEAEEGILRVYSLNKNQVIELEIGSWENVYIEYVYDDIVVVDGNVGMNWYTKVFRGSELLYDLEGNYFPFYSDQDNHTDHIMLMSPSGLGEGYINLILTSEGELLYESLYPEQIISLDKELIQLQRGNYNMVTDYAGNILLKEIKNELSND